MSTGRADTAEAAAAESGGARKIVHIDMDCFYAAIEVRDAPELRGRPVAVGGSSSRRGVLTTCNYEAREFGCRSAMPTYKALQRCPELVVVPVRFDVYREESARIRTIFRRFTDLVEPLSLDEAYLDLSHWRSPARVVAREIRQEIREQTGLTASAGIGPNKLLAKIASDWNKPDGQYKVAPEGVTEFMKTLPVRRLWGVGKKTAEKLGRHGVVTCADLQRWSQVELQSLFGKFGVELYHQCRGEDEREVQPFRERKSVSNERTYAEDLVTLEEGLEKLEPLWTELCDDLRSKHARRRIKSGFVKLRFQDFQQTTVERQTSDPSWELYEELLAEGWKRAGDRQVRLLGAGARFVEDNPDRSQGAAEQLLLFDQVGDGSAVAAADDERDFGDDEMEEGREGSQTNR